VSDAFREALSIVDFGPDDEVRSALPALLAEARQRDSLTLLSLLRRLSSAGRGEVCDRLSALLPPPAEVTRERIAGADREAIDDWWKALSLPRPRKLYPRLWGFGSQSPAAAQPRRALHPGSRLTPTSSHRPGARLK
jgi:hypothetical protein